MDDYLYDCLEDLEVELTAERDLKDLKNMFLNGFKLKDVLVLCNKKVIETRDYINRFPYRIFNPYVAAKIEYCRGMGSIIKNFSSEAERTTAPEMKVFVDNIELLSNKIRDLIKQ